jgi:hypothetical protein
VVKDSARFSLGVYGQPPDLVAAYHAVFGRPGQDRDDAWRFQAAIPAHDSDGAEAHGATSPTVVSIHNRVDRLTGVVPPEALHDREVARATALVTEIEPPHQFDPLERALLTAAVLGVEAVGARRSRGLGRVRPGVHWEAPTSATQGRLNAAELLAPLRALGPAGGSAA